MLLTDLRDGFALQQVLAQDVDFFLRRIVPATVRVLVVHALFRLRKSSLIQLPESVIPSEAQQDEDHRRAGQAACPTKSGKRYHPCPRNRLPRGQKAFNKKSC